MKRGFEPLFFFNIREKYKPYYGRIPKYISKERIKMMTFVIVMLAILAANLIWTVGMFAFMNTKAFQKLMVKWVNGYIEKIEFDEEGL